MTSLPPVCDARVIGAVCAEKLPTCETQEALFEELAFRLHWTVRGGYPMKARVEAALGLVLGHNQSMTRRRAQQFLQVVGATDADYHNTAHRLECSRLGVIDINQQKGSS